MYISLWMSSFGFALLDKIWYRHRNAFRKFEHVQTRFWKGMPWQGALEITDGMFLEIGKKEGLRTQKDDVLFHVVSSTLWVFSLGLVRGPTIIISQGYSIYQQASSTQLGKDKWKENSSLNLFVVSFNFYFGLIVGFTHKTNMGVCAGCL